MSEQPPTPAQTKHISAESETPGHFLLRVARALSGARRDNMFEDLTRAASELLEADIGLLGRYLEVEGVPSIETLACCAGGRLLPNRTYALAGTPCETVMGQEFRFYPEQVADQFPQSDALENEIVGYAAFPLFGDSGEQLGIFSVMSRRELKDAERAESLLRIFSERAVAEIHRMRAEEALRKSEEHYRSMFNASADGLALLSPERVIVDVNPAIERLYGYSRQEMVGQKALNFTHGSHREKAAQFLRAVRDQNFASMVDKAFHRDGSEFYIEPRGVTVDYDGRPHILMIVRDVTERERSEEKRAALEAQLRQAQKMEAIGHLTGGVAHDFNNILTSVLGYVELAHEHVESQNDDKLNRYLDRAQRSGGRARDLIQQMLTFSRGQHGEPRALSLAPIVEDTVSLIESMVPSTVTIFKRIDRELPLVEQDPVHVEQILINLCLNARDATDGTGSLSVALRVSDCAHDVCSSCRRRTVGEFVEMSVKDTGSGMEAALIDRIFEPFFSTKETGKGSGMGLSTVHGIAHEYGGHIVVRSELGIGTEVRVLFPITDEQPPVTTVDAGTDTHKTMVELTGQVLLVDDNETVAEFVTDLLSDWGLEVTVFNDGEAALKHLQARVRPFDLAILDEALPVVTGSELAGLFLNHQADLPIVLYTGYGESLSDENIRDRGLRAVIRKPIDTEQLNSLIKDILSA